MYLLRLITLVFLLLTLTVIASAQHQGHQTSNPTASPTPDATPSPSASSGQTHQHSPEMDMPAASPSFNQMNSPKPIASPSSSASTGMGLEVGSLIVMEGDEMGIRVGSSDTNVISMGAMGSGTSRQPSSGPMHVHQWIKGDWVLMFHYNLFAGVNRQGGARGVTKFESTSWFMPMAYHKLGNGTLQLRGMFSAEPFTVPPGGSRLLFQTGETYKGQSLIDHQHPHDLYSVDAHHDGAGPIEVAVRVVRNEAHVKSFSRIIRPRLIEDRH